MNKNHVLSLLLAIALFITTFKMIEMKQEVKENMQSATTKKEAVLSVIHSRKSVRKYTDKLVSKEDLNTIMRAGMAAPSGHDTRPWKFIAITNRDTMLELRKELEWARGLDGSPAAIVVCGDMSKVDERNPEFWITDASAATQNMLLAIEAMGLGGVWSTLYPGEKRMSYARKVLNLPENIMPLCVIPIGYPTGLEKAKDKFDASNIHWDKW
jgi:nitroreductase